MTEDRLITNGGMPEWNPKRYKPSKRKVVEPSDEPYFIVDGKKYTSLEQYYSDKK